MKVSVRSILQRDSLIFCLTLLASVAIVASASEPAQAEGEHEGHNHPAPAKLVGIVREATRRGYLAGSE